VVFIFVNKNELFEANKKKCSILGQRDTGNKDKILLDTEEHREKESEAWSEGNKQDRFKGEQKGQ